MEIAPALCVDVVDRHHQITPAASLHICNFSPLDRAPVPIGDETPRRNTPDGARRSNRRPITPEPGMSLDFFEKLFNVDALLASSRAAMWVGTKATTSSFQSIGAALQ